jgi:iron complex outermembrane receptor protein
MGDGSFAAGAINGSQPLYALPNTLSWDIPAVLAQNFARSCLHC